jgi:hypothetical protein
MAWLISCRDVDIWWELRLHRRLYKRSLGYHHIYLPPGLVIRWGRSTHAVLKDQGVEW